MRFLENAKKYILSYTITSSKVFFMLVKRAIMILLGLLLLMGPVTAYYADPTHGTGFSPSDSTKIWIIADTGQQNVIKLVAYNTTPGFVGPIINAPVAFSIDNPLLGTITPVSNTTDSNGVALCTFTVNATHPTSGTARITANVVSGETSGVTYHSILYWDQKIDHNVPYNAVFYYSNDGSVETVIPVTISLFDRWGNVVDNRFETEKSLPAHNITLHVNGPSPPNNCGFTDYGLVHDKTFNLDANGNVTVNITPATKPGWHYILMDSMGSIPEQMKLFDTVANGKPFSMTQSFSPDGSPYATVLADGTSKFTFYYSLYDKYGNPTQDQGVWINTSDGNILQTSMETTGQVWSTYGPKSFTGLYPINATAAGNTTLMCNKTVRFYNTTAVNIDMSANPQTMPSRDANSAIYSNISAKITDIMGNGVAGEVVTFTLHDMVNSPVSANETKNSSFSSSSKLWTTTATSDAQGYATVNLYPAKYAIATELGYQQQVSGTGIVTAAWKGNQTDIHLTWKNYPYLSAVVAVNPQKVKVGDSVNVSIKLNGDGWALVPKPSDVVLVTDLSGSMLDTMGTGTKLTATKTALKQFVALSNGKMYLSLASFANDPSGYSTQAMQLWNLQNSGTTPKPFDPYMDKSLMTAAYQQPNKWYGDARIDTDLTTDSPTLNNTIGNFTYTYGSYTYTGYGANGGTDLAGGLEAGLTELNTKGYAGHNMSIVIMTDGIANMAPVNSSFPLKAYIPSDYDGTGSTIAKTAAIKIASAIKADARNIKIYTIAFGSDADTATLTSIASPGCNYVASDATALSTVYQTIYGQVFTDASVDTDVALDMHNLIVNSNPVSAGNYFNYQYNTTTSPGSTMLDKYNKTPLGAINQHLVPGFDVSTGLPFPSIGPIIINQTDYWNDAAHPQQLAFNIGTIKLNETWQADFSLQVLKEGDIQVFGPASQVCFQNGAAGATFNNCMGLGNASFTASMNPTNLGVSENIIKISGLARTDGGLDDPVKGTLPVTWTTVYTGSSMITEEVSYIYNGGVPVRFDVKTLNPAAGDLNSPQISILNTDKLPPGGYTIQVHAFTNDATDTNECGPYSFTTQGRSFIKLE